MAKGMKGGSTISTEYFWYAVIIVASLIQIYYFYYGIVDFFVEISRRSWAAILGGLVGIWFAPSLTSMQLSNVPGAVVHFLLIVFPGLVWTFDQINDQLPQNEYVKTTASFVEGGLMGAIVTTIIANMFPVRY
jgi:hypothetical protein